MLYLLYIHYIFIYIIYIFIIYLYTLYIIHIYNIYHMCNIYIYIIYIIHIYQNQFKRVLIPQGHHNFFKITTWLFFNDNIRIKITYAAIKNVLLIWKYISFAKNIYANKIYMFRENTRFFIRTSKCLLRLDVRIFVRNFLLECS